MLDVKYRRARTVAEAHELAAKARGGATFICGGTDLIVKMKAGKLRPATWIDISKLKELRSIEEREEEIYIGAATTYRALEFSPAIKRELPCLHQAVLEVGSPQIRALGTLGGNFANASPAGDGIPPFFAMAGQVVLTGPQGERTVAAESFFRGPGRTILAPGEVIQGFRVPRWAHHRAAFLKLGPRKSLSIAKVSLAIALQIQDGVIRNPRLGLGAVAPTVIRGLKAEKFLEGKAPKSEVYEEAARLTRQEVMPISDFRSTAEYRREMSGTLVARALATLCGDAAPRSRGWDVEIR
jgi:CO/xanthine dehydrogenase FAD-binding subunit